MNLAPGACVLPVIIFPSPTTRAYKMNQAPATRLLILGSGPAGYTAAVYAARANLKPVLITGMAQGGPIDDHHRRRQLAGRRRRRAGPRPDGALREACRALPDRDHLRPHPHRAADRKADPPDRRFRRIHLRRADHRHRRLGPVPGPAFRRKFSGKGVSACATCDGFFYKNQPVAVIGGGNTAVEEALYLANIASHVTVVHRRDKFRGEKILQDKLFEKEKAGKVTIKWDHTLDEVLGDLRRHRHAHQAREDRRHRGCRR
jgi:thioredoxin reductase (NADPH)